MPKFTDQTANTIYGFIQRFLETYDHTYLLDISTKLKNNLHAIHALDDNNLSLFYYFTHLPTQTDLHTHFTKTTGLLMAISNAGISPIQGLIYDDIDSLAFHLDALLFTTNNSILDREQAIHMMIGTDTGNHTPLHIIIQKNYPSHLASYLEKLFYLLTPQEHGDFFNSDDVMLSGVNHFEWLETHGNYIALFTYLNHLQMSFGPAQSLQLAFTKTHQYLSTDITHEKDSLYIAKAMSVLRTNDSPEKKWEALGSIHQAALFALSRNLPINFFRPATACEIIDDANDGLAHAPGLASPTHRG